MRTGTNDTYRTESLKKSVMLVAAFAAFLNPFLSSSINIALPAIGKDLNASAVELGWVATSFILATAIFLLPVGRLADIKGRMKVFKTGIFLFTVTTFIIIFTRNITSLIILRIFQGVAAAMFFSTSLAIITSVFPQGKRGRAIGINITSVYLGLSAGPVIGGFLTRHLGWRSIFISLVPVGIFSLIIIYRKIKTEWADAVNEKFDWKGSLIYGVAMALFFYGFSSLPSMVGWVCLISGLIFGLIFIYFEKTVDYPVFDIRLFIRNRVFAFSSIAALIHYAATAATGFFLSLYLQFPYKLDARSAGLVMISQPLAMMLLSPVAGKLSDRFNPGVIASAGMALIATVLTALCFLETTTPLAVIVVLLVIMGTGFAFFSSPNSNAIMGSVEKKNLGMASGVVGTMRMTGQTVSMGIAMMILAVFVGKQPLSELTIIELMAGMKTAFIIFSGLCFLGIFASLARNKKTNKMFDPRL